MLTSGSDPTNGNLGGAALRPSGPAIASACLVGVLTLAVVAALALGAGVAGAQVPDRPWMNTSLSPDQRAELLLAQMTLEEKVDLMTGDDPAPAGTSAYFNAAIPRLGIPELRTADIGPGVRFGATPTTAFPMGIATAATWNTSLAQPLSRAVVEEARATRHNMVLGPNVDITRNPWWGRIGETFGEDTLLSSRMAAGFVRGAQARRDMPVNLKHYNLYTQETNRCCGQDSLATERTIQEVYTPPWEAAVDEGLASVMCAFNKVNGVYSCENGYLQEDILRRQLGFRGFILSDFGAAHSTVASAQNGLDMETGVSGLYYGPALLAAVQAGQVSVALVDYHVRNILRIYFAHGIFDRPLPAEFQPIPVEEHGGLAREIQQEAITLLRNSNAALPLPSRRVDSIAVIGGDADWAVQESGAGAVVNPTYQISPLEGIRRRAGGDVDVEWSPGTDPVGPWTMLPGPSAVPSSVLSPPDAPGQSGLRAEYFASTDFAGAPLAVRTDPQAAFDLAVLATFAANPRLVFPPTGAQAVRFTGTITPPESGDYTFSLSGFGDARLYLNGELVASFTGQSQPRDVRSRTLTLEGGQSYDIRVEYAATRPIVPIDAGAFQLGWTHPDTALAPDMRDAVDAARRSDAAVIVVRPYESEQRDRAQLRLPNDQDQLIEAVSRVNDRTVVVLESGGPVTMPWLGQVDSVLQGYYGGQEQGRALADVLFGDVNPSGKLPISYPRFESQPERLGIRNPVLSSESLEVPFTEGVFLGYKGYEREGTRLQFPFGHGLSYTRFRYRRLSTEARGAGAGDIRVRFTVRNIGRRTGREVAQVYVGALPTSVPTPPKQLASFAKVNLDPRDRERLTVTLDPHALSYWDEAADRWVTPRGTVPIYVGSSVEDIRLTGSVRIR
jgi:beta-glucosidase